MNEPRAAARPANDEQWMPLPDVSFPPPKPGPSAARTADASTFAAPQAAPAPPGPQPMNIRPPASAMATAPGATTTRPVAAWRTPMYTLLVLCALLPVMSFVVLAVALDNLGRRERREQALTLVVITLVTSVGYVLVARSVV